MLTPLIFHTSLTFKYSPYPPITNYVKVVSDTMEYRQKHQLRRSDFLQILLDASLQEKNNNNKNNSEGGEPQPIGQTLSDAHSIVHGG